MVSTVAIVDSFLSRLLKIKLLPYCSMHVLPFSHKDGVYRHDTDSTGHIEYQMVKKPNPDDVSIDNNILP